VSRGQICLACAMCNAGTHLAPRIARIGKPIDMRWSAGATISAMGGGDKARTMDWQRGHATASSYLVSNERRDAPKPCLRPPRRWSPRAPRRTLLDRVPVDAARDQWRQLALFQNLQETNRYFDRTPAVRPRARARRSLEADAQDVDDAVGLVRRR